MSEKPAGWYYVGDGKLRYRDEYGWTAYFMDTNDPRAKSWPPPKPKTMLQQVREEERAREREKRRQATGLSKWIKRPRGAKRAGGAAS